MDKRNQINGFTLIEMLLVAAIIGIVMASTMQYWQQRVMQSRIDRTAAQLQQILNAGMAFYVNNPPNGNTTPPIGGWPPSIKCLQGTVSNTTCNSTVIYLPTSLTANPWGQNYAVGVDVMPTTTTEFAKSPVFYAWTSVTAASGSTLNESEAAAIADAIAGQLPLSYTTAKAATGNAPPAPGTVCGSSTTCYVVAAVNIPGQSLNSAAATQNPTAVSFAGLYHHGGCVPVPTCTSGYTPQVFIVPASVSGVNDASPPTSNPNNLYPINSFTAYAIGSGTDTTPKQCDGVTAGTSCGATSDPSGTYYWRACLQVITEDGIVSGSAWGDYVSLMAITRCTPTAGEPSGSPFSVFGP